MTSGDRCTAGYYCPGNTCVVDPHQHQGVLGQGCEFEEDCQVGLVCPFSTLTCTAPLHDGDPCDPQFGAPCPGYCDPAIGSCKPAPGPGGACGELSFDAGFGSQGRIFVNCAAGDYCEAFTTCAAQKQDGASCTYSPGVTYDNECASYVCLPDGGCESTAIASACHG